MARSIRQAVRATDLLRGDVVVLSGVSYLVKFVGTPSLLDGTVKVGLADPAALTGV